MAGKDRWASATAPEVSAMRWRAARRVIIRVAWCSVSSSQVLQKDVFEFHDHRWAGMNLQCEDALERAPFLVVVDQLDGFETVEVMFDMIAPRHDEVFVPILRLVIAALD